MSYSEIVSRMTYTLCESGAPSLERETNMLRTRDME